MSPVFGLIVDRTGYKTIWIILAALVALAAHSTMLFTFVNAFVPVITLALSLSIIATSLWPMVSDLVPLNKLGSAYGLMQGIQNLGLAVTSGLSGYLVENYGYMALDMFFIVLCIIGLVASFFLYVIDKAKGMFG
jgi:MFS family permease